MNCRNRMILFFLFKQKTAYDMRISDWSSDVCSSDLIGFDTIVDNGGGPVDGRIDEAPLIARAGPAVHGTRRILPDAPFRACRLPGPFSVVIILHSLVSVRSSCCVGTGINRGGK